MPIDKEDGVVGKNIPHDSAHGHVSGESIYVDDMPFASNELFVDFYPSPVAHGKITKLDLFEASKTPGVVGLYTCKDLGGQNKFGPIIADETLLVDEVAEFIGHPIVVIAAESRQAIKAAKKAIKLEMEELKPVFTIGEAIAKKQFISETRVIKRGDVDEAFKAAKHVIEGTFINGGQDHFYLESQAAIVYPGEYDTLTIHSSTQNPSEIQEVVAHVLGLKHHQVICITKRMGGGFGGKECQATHPAAMAALVAHKTKRPARIAYNKDDDMMYTGGRHPFQNQYKVAFTDEGLITALQTHLYTDGGAANDLSTAVLGRAMVHAENAYYIANAEITGTICKTNFPPNTAFRGFGGPQGVANIENIIEEVATYLKKDPLEIRQLNCYGINDRNITPYGQVVYNNMLPELFEQLAKSSDYKRRLEEVKEFNAKSKTQLKGLSLTPVKFGISFNTKFLNQANALVLIYKDGTVQVTTGATEMGQGVNTKIRQLVAEEFTIDVKCVVVMPTQTDKNNNTSATAASSAADLNGSAAVNACVKIKERLTDCASKFLASVEAGLTPSPGHIVFEKGQVFDLRRPEKRLSFAELVELAYHERVNLGERGFYATQGIDFSWKTGTGSPFLYFTQGVACSEVLIDRFTGELKVRRVDLLMDVGKSINPGIDRGQVIGAFIQGMGWVTTEELKYGSKGELLSHSPTTYKIPNIQDTPEVFNVAFIPNEGNVVNIRASKAVGEPPLLLGISVWTAVKHALSFVSNGDIPKLNMPATSEEILTRITHYSKQAVGASK
ncbi:MAG: xanthine dehydrogenase molybdopterin binding subunit [Candidatus Obscuribacterales bacterium]|nr:xanthine dehydrogenase molybdopterin binding subunit [Candidatus Obscuribacterales bacterium]